MKRQFLAVLLMAVWLGGAAAAGEPAPAQATDGGRAPVTAGKPLPPTSVHTASPEAASGGAAPTAPPPGLFPYGLPANQAGVSTGGGIEGVPPLPAPLMNRAYDWSMQQAYPLTPEQIKQFGQFLQDQEKAAEAGKPHPKARSRLAQVELVPGSEPLRVELAAGYVTALVFVDSDGTPWPATSAVAATEDFQVAIQKAEKHNLVTVAPLKNFASGNLVVTLQGADQPLAILLETSRQVADYRVIVRVIGHSPLAPQVAAVADNEQAVASPALRDVVQGLPPDGAKPASMSGAPGQAWEAPGGILYLRTPWRVVIPAWRASVELYGMHGYELDQTPDLVMESEDGKTHQVTVGDETGGSE